MLLGRLVSAQLIGRFPSSGTRLFFLLSLRLEYLGYSWCKARNHGLVKRPSRACIGTLSLRWESQKIDWKASF